MVYPELRRAFSALIASITLFRMTVPFPAASFFPLSFSNYGCTSLLLDNKPIRPLPFIYFDDFVP